jgi:RNA polymerase sigma factor (sigma-70 family)
MENELYGKLETLAPTLKRIAARYATNEFDADDIYQGIIEKVIKTCTPTDTKSYICQLATWTARNIVKAERIYLRYVTVVDDKESDEGETLDFTEIFSSQDALTPEEMLIESETYREMDAILAFILPQLDDTNRSIIGMLRQHMTHQAIADMLDMTRTAVSNRVQKMRGVFQMAGLTPAFLTA